MGEFENIGDVLHMLQTSISLPKGKRNDFGKYNYRTAEGILAAVKDFLPAGAHIVLSDAPSQFGDKLVLIAMATLHWMGNEVSASSFALHAYTKKGMDEAQISGAASSYARKYALGGLLAIDDGERDPDAGKKPPEGAPKNDDVKPLHQAKIDAVKDSLPANASPRVTAEAFADAIIAEMASKKKPETVDRVWHAWGAYIGQFQEKYSDLYDKVFNAWEEYTQQGG